MSSWTESCSIEPGKKGLSMNKLHQITGPIGRHLFGQQVNLWVQEKDHRKTKPM